jgi:hypothetical protein
MTPPGAGRGKGAANPHAGRQTDPALATNLEEIVRQCFEAGASVAYIMHGPPSVVLRDDDDYALAADPAGTALVVLFRCRVPGPGGMGAVRMEVRRPEDGDEPSPPE